MIAFDDAAFFFELAQPFADRRKRKPDGFGKLVAFSSSLRLEPGEDRKIDLIKPHMSKRRCIAMIFFWQRSKFYVFTSRICVKNPFATVIFSNIRNFVVQI